MEKVVIRNYVPGDAPRVAEVQKRCLGAGPDTSRFAAAFWNGPGFEEGRNIFCAVDGREELLGYAALNPGPVSQPPGRGAVAAPSLWQDQGADPGGVEGESPGRGTVAAPSLWLDLGVEPGRVDAEALREILFWRAHARARQIARDMPGQRVALSATYFSEDRASIEYLEDKGFSHYQTCYTMRRDLAEPIPELLAPRGLAVRAGQIEPEAQQLAYLAACETAFQNGEPPEGLQRLVAPGNGSEGRAFTAFDGQQIAGSATAWYRPGSRAAGKTETVFVLPEWRRRGIGRYLLAESLCYLREQGLAFAEIEIDGANEPARALCESLGYRVSRNEVSLGLLLET